MVEHLLAKQKAAGSTPVLRSTPQSSRSSVGLEHWITNPKVGGSSPSEATILKYKNCARVAQIWPEHTIGKGEVAGSNPAAGTKWTLSSVS